MEQQAGLTGYAANLRALGVPPGALISKFVSNEDGTWLVVLKPPVPGSKHGTRAPGPVSAKQAGRQAAYLSKRLAALPSGNVEGRPGAPTVAESPGGAAPTNGGAAPTNELLELPNRTLQTCPMGARDITFVAPLTPRLMHSSMTHMKALEKLSISYVKHFL